MKNVKASQSRFFEINSTFIEFIYTTVNWKLYTRRARRLYLCCLMHLIRCSQDLLETINILEKYVQIESKDQNIKY